jgi:hypothetical protein
MRSSLLRPLVGSRAAIRVLLHEKDSLHAFCFFGTEKKQFSREVTPCSRRIHSNDSLHAFCFFGTEKKQYSREVTPCSLLEKDSFTQIESLLEKDSLTQIEGIIVIIIIIDLLLF